MPGLENTLQNILLRSCAYGQAKRRKTWWAMTAAEAGFNVLDLDLEDNHGDLRCSARRFLHLLP